MEVLVFLVSSLKAQSLSRLNNISLNKKFSQVFRKYFLTFFYSKKNCLFNYPPKNILLNFCQGKPLQSRYEIFW